MKIKTSITLESDLISAIDQQTEAFGSRSEFLEAAARQMLSRLTKAEQERRDLELINRRAVILNREAADILDYQVGL
jgi:metal-responsive CopG/Arc/MetJ family transcriptional regulator